jgi:virulence-associated protein VagC
MSLVSSVFFSLETPRKQHINHNPVPTVIINSGSSIIIRPREKEAEEEKEVSPAPKEEFDMSLREYCEQTSLHGWCYMTSDRRLWKYAWTLVVLTSIGVASVFVYKASEEFTKATVVTTIHSTTEPLSEVFFPAVTVCNINQVGDGKIV